MLYQFTYKGNKTILIHQYANKKIRENSSLTNFRQKIILNIICIIFLCNHGIRLQICIKKYNYFFIVKMSLSSLLLNFPIQFSPDETVISASSFLSCIIALIRSSKVFLVMKR